MIHYQEIPSSKVPDLSNPIHPVFRSANFSSAFQYDILVPALRLATQFLLSNSVVAYINTIFDGVIRDPLGAVCMTPTYEEMKNREGFWSVWPSPGMEHLTHETKQKAMLILYQMKDVITFDLRCHENTSVNAKCVALNRFDHGSAPMPFRGVKSRIELSTKEYAKLARLTRQNTADLSRQSQETQPPRTLIEQCFIIARYLVHEFSHALSFAAHGILPRELCYKDSVMAEAGFEFEAQVFGCLINLESNISWRLADLPHWDAHRSITIPSMPIATEWPSPKRAIIYLKETSKHLWAGGQLPRYELAWRIPRSFLTDLFMNEFWNTHHSRQDSLPVPVPMVGCCIWWFPEMPLSLEDYWNQTGRTPERSFRAVQR